MKVANKKVWQDFLNENLCKELRKNGIDFEDAKYVCIDNQILFKSDVENVEERVEKGEGFYTYTLPELLYKLPEWIEDPNLHPKGSFLSFWKDAPFYIFCYESPNGCSVSSQVAEYPIEAAAFLLIACMERGIGCIDDIGGKE